MQVAATDAVRYRAKAQNWVNLPTETLLADRTEEHAQGRVKGAHFAWSRLWWTFTLPLASCLIGGLIG
ncbi:MAG: hypothetical protein U5J97_10295 [Trueperaceae bacterium]|nr:hypothetical protein [Trueperaceae bacterium]